MNKKDISPEDFDRLLDEHFSNDTGVRRSNAKRGQISPFKGKSHNNNAKEKMSQAHIGRDPYNKGQPRDQSTKDKISESVTALQGVKCVAIDPNGIIYEFDTIKDCEFKLNYKNLTPNALNIFPLDGSKRMGRRGKWKGWTFFRIV